MQNNFFLSFKLKTNTTVEIAIAVIAWPDVTAEW